MSSTSRTATRVYDAPGRDAVLEAVRTLHGRRGQSPTVADVVEYLELSRRTVRDHLTALEELGFTRRRPAGASGALVVDVLEQRRRRAS